MVLGLADAQGVATSGTDDACDRQAGEISKFRRTAKWHQPPKEIKEEERPLSGKKLKLFQGVVARFNYFAVDMPRPSVLGHGLMLVPVVYGDES